MTIAELISELQAYPPETRVTLFDPDTSRLMPIRIRFLEADGMDRAVDFVGITSDYSLAIEGSGPSTW